MAVILENKCSFSLLTPCIKVTSYLPVVLLICLYTMLLCNNSNCLTTTIKYVHWNTTNPIFRIDNTDHIIDVNKGSSQNGYDQVQIICPVYTPGTYNEDVEKYIIYNVSKEEYETCRITNPNPRMIAVCDKPYKVMYFTLTFRPFTPQPGGFEFHPGLDYYFISTSSKDDLHRRFDGRCLDNNMKVVFKVCCRPEDTANATTARTSSTYTTLSTLPSVRVTQTSTSTTLLHATPDHPPTRKPVKKINEYDKHPNEVVKNEELYSSGVWLSAGPPGFLVVAACIAVIRWR